MAMLRSCGYCLALLLACLAAADATTSAPSALPSPLPAPLPTPLPTPHWYLRGATDAPTAAPTGTRRSWDRVKDTQCPDTIGERIYAKADARARCEALDSCDGYQYTKAANNFYILCGFKGKKDGCGRPRIDRVEDGAEDSNVVMCRPYDTTPAWRDPVAFWLCLFIAVVVSPLCFVMSLKIQKQAEQADGGGSTNHKQDELKCKLGLWIFLFVVFASIGLICFAVSRGPTAVGEKDGCDDGLGEDGLGVLAFAGAVLLACVVPLQGRLHALHRSRRDGPASAVAPDAVAPDAVAPGAVVPAAVAPRIVDTPSSRENFRREVDDLIDECYGVT
jgi:hypothetical protein